MFIIIGPLRLYQFILIIIAIGTLAFVYHRWRSKKTTPATFGLWIVAWIVVLYFAFNPNSSDPLAGIFGIGRGVDLLLVVGLILSLYLNFRLYIKFDDLNQQINELVRALAIRDEITLDDEDE